MTIGGVEILCVTLQLSPQESPKIDFRHTFDILSKSGKVVFFVFEINKAVASILKKTAFFGPFFPIFGPRSKFFRK